MQATEDHGAEPVRKDLGMILWLVAACPFGLLMWAGLLAAVQWSVVAAWALLVGLAADPVHTVSAPN